MQEMENLRNALQEDCNDGFDDITARQRAAILSIEALDRENEQAEGPPSYSRELIEELKALVTRIAEVNEELIKTAEERAKGIQQELGTLHRTMGAVAGYRKQADVKI